MHRRVAFFCYTWESARGIIWRYVARCKLAREGGKVRKLESWEGLIDVSHMTPELSTPN